MRECLEKEPRVSNAALKRAEEQAAAAISKWDENARFINIAKKKLGASNKTYEQYRDAQCASASSLGGGAIGDAIKLRRLSCFIELDSGREKTTYYLRIGVAVQVIRDVTNSSLAAMKTLTRAYRPIARTF